MPRRLPASRLSGGGAERVFIVEGGSAATLRHLTITNGFGFDLAGGILNNGTVNLERCVVTGNVVGANANDFWKGGGGIYSGGNSTLNVFESTVSNNRTTLVDGGGIYAFFNAAVRIENSTVSGNVAGNVGGGIRMLGNATIVNSTLSGNTSSAWFGGALFHTDGVANLVNSTVTANVAPAFGNAALFVGTFTAANATLNITNSIVAENRDLDGNPGTGCFVAPFGSGVVTLISGGNNVFTDATCAPVASDQVVATAALGPLAANGGPTLTHALNSGSPALEQRIRRAARRRISEGLSARKGRDVTWAPWSNRCPEISKGGQPNYWPAGATISSCRFGMSGRGAAVRSRAGAPASGSARGGAGRSR